MKLTFILLFLLKITSLFSQEAIVGEYYLFYHDKSYPVIAALDLNDNIVYKIKTPRKEGLTEELWLIIPPRKLERFINLLDVIIETFPKWEKTAIVNKIKTVEREILPYKHPKIKVKFSYGNTIYLDSLVFPIAIFKVANRIPYIELRSTYWMMADYNEYITAEPFIIPFNSIEEVKEFKDLLNDDLAYDKIIEKLKKENLFKQ